MQLPSHLLITAFIDQHVSEKHVRKHTLAFLLGSVLPDFPFAVLTLLYSAYYKWFGSLPPNSTSNVMEYLHFELFFRDPVWIIGHNTFHSLVVNISLLMIGVIGMRYRSYWGFTLFWLSAGMGIHTVIDVFTHTNDGPLIFFPINWTFRFRSPVSYWEPDHFGATFMIIEYSVDAAIVTYLLARWMWYRRHNTSAKRWQGWRKLFSRSEEND
ncbi:MAG: metal-dependent hydrolase [Anaerolineae bacterium]|nr:metal-dependent hydrolase [Anaerolineae bacterium]